MDTALIEARIEAILFATGEPVNREKLAKFLNITPKHCSSAIQNIIDRYEQVHAGISIIQKKDDVQMVSAQVHGQLVASFLNKQLSEDLSTAASEVLAVVAYRGPITRAGIEQIRGVSCSFTLRNLAMRGLVERRENPDDNRSYVYEVSFDFLKSMGLPSIEALPDYQQLHTALLPTEHPVPAPSDAPSEDGPPEIAPGAPSAL